MDRDSVDEHVEQWRDHWILESSFDDQVEAAMVRIIRLDRHLIRSTRDALAHSPLQDFEYETLHSLLVRDPSGRASPSELSRELSLSPAGTTGRVDGLERRGFVKRVASSGDRRRVEIEVTRAGLNAWRQASQARESAERNLAGALTRKELATLNALLRKMLARAERPDN